MTDIDANAVLPEWATIEEDDVLITVPEQYDEAVARYQYSPLFHEAVTVAVDREVGRKTRYTIPGFLATTRGRVIQIGRELLAGEVIPDG